MTVANASVDPRPNVVAEYSDLPEATAATFTDDGFFRTGDVGQLDDAGDLRIVGRSKELIITGGDNMDPREVPDVLRIHSSVVDVAALTDLAERELAPPSVRVCSTGSTPFRATRWARSSPSGSPTPVRDGR